MDHYVISSHGHCVGELFYLPENCELRFYVHEGNELYNQYAYPVLHNIMNTANFIRYATTPPVEIIVGPIQTYDYNIWNGNWPFANGINPNGIFIPHKNIPLNDLGDTDYTHPIRLSQIVRNRHIVNNYSVFYCLFCRT